MGGLGARGGGEVWGGGEGEAAPGGVTDHADRPCGVGVDVGGDEVGGIGDRGGGSVLGGERVDRDDDLGAGLASDLGEGTRSARRYSKGHRILQTSSFHHRGVR